MGNKKDSLGDRMKGYESVPDITLTRRTPLILRLDGKAFHTFTKKCDRPFDSGFSKLMELTAFYLLKEIQGAKLVYTQSDEISVLITDYDTLTTDSWFGKRIQKMCSIAASMATMKFNQLFPLHIPADKLTVGHGLFDCRAFTLPKEEVNNYFVWRQQDATRNSIQMLGQSHFSHKSLHGVSCNGIQDRLMVELGINWNDVETRFKRGLCIHRTDKYEVDTEIPIFNKDPEYVEQFVYLEDKDEKADC